MSIFKNPIIDQYNFKKNLIYFSSPTQFDHFNIKYFTIFHRKPDQSSDQMKAMMPAGAWVHVHQVVFFIFHYFGDMRMSGNKKSKMLFFEF